MRAISCCWAGAGPGLRRAPVRPVRPGGRVLAADGLGADGDRGLDGVVDPVWAVDPDEGLGPDEDMSPDRAVDSDRAVGQEDRDLGHGENLAPGPAAGFGGW
jgi:hypothetical protein